MPRFTIANLLVLTTAVALFTTLCVRKPSVGIPILVGGAFLGLGSAIVYGIVWVLYELVSPNTPSDAAEECSDDSD